MPAGRPTEEEINKLSFEEFCCKYLPKPAPFNKQQLAHIRRIQDQFNGVKPERKMIIATRGQLSRMRM